MKITRSLLRRLISEEVANFSGPTGESSGLVFIPGFKYVVTALAPNGTEPDYIGAEVLPDGPWRAAWEEGNMVLAATELKNLGVTHIGGNEGDQAAEALGLQDTAIVPIDQWSKIPF